jgi:hypothetical protein
VTEDDSYNPFIETENILLSLQDNRRFSRKNKASESVRNNPNTRKRNCLSTILNDDNNDQIYEEGYSLPHILSKN